VSNVELCEIVDEAGRPTGQIVARGARLEAGRYYLVVHVWIRDESGAFLIQQRAAHVESAPGVWATTAGYVQAGEDSASAAIREAHEELGIELDPRQLTHFGRAAWRDLLSDVWLAHVSRAAVEHLQPGAEVSACRWVSRAEMLKLAEQGEFFSYTYLYELPA
jgi:8-oxo-dGTP pyrophosphatase MutT (NUDIX family)